MLENDAPIRRDVQSGPHAQLVNPTRTAPPVRPGLSFRQGRQCLPTQSHVPGTKSQDEAKLSLDKLDRAATVRSRSGMTIPTGRGPIFHAVRGAVLARRVRRRAAPRRCTCRMDGAGYSVDRQASREPKCC